jgi:hypothetical protein
MYFIKYISVYNITFLSPCCPLNMKRCFGGTCRLRLQDRRISQERNQNDAGDKFCRASNILRDLISQKIDLFLEITPLEVTQCSWTHC